MREKQYELSLPSMPSLQKVDTSGGLDPEKCEEAYRYSQDRDWMEAMSRLLSSPGHIMLPKNAARLQLIDEIGAGMLKFGKDGWERVSGKSRGE